LFDGTRVRPDDTPDGVCIPSQALKSWIRFSDIMMQYSLIWPTVIPWRCTRSKLEAIKEIILS
jgi:hypothetical protein